MKYISLVSSAAVTGGWTNQQVSGSPNTRGSPVSEVLAAHEKVCNINISRSGNLPNCPLFWGMSEYISPKQNRKKAFKFCPWMKSLPTTSSKLARGLPHVSTTIDMQNKSQSHLTQIYTLVYNGTTTIYMYMYVSQFSV